MQSSTPRVHPRRLRALLTGRDIATIRRSFAATAPAGRKRAGGEPERRSGDRERRELTHVPESA